ncbi:MAG: hypothetical protein LH468_02210 [Nocardioides sp.]|nr:hypothetical protein [Nocardioides sp.]
MATETTETTETTAPDTAPPERRTLAGGRADAGNLPVELLGSPDLIG